MSDDSSSTERHRNIWAPWRMEYIDTLSNGEDNGCFICHHRDDPAGDAKNFVLWRGQQSFAMLNLFPYTAGHAMVAPYDHAPELSQIDEPTLLEMMKLLRDLQVLLTRAISAQGFNIGRPRPLD